MKTVLANLLAALAVLVVLTLLSPCLDTSNPLLYSVPGLVMFGEALERTRRSIPDGMPWLTAFSPYVWTAENFLGFVLPWAMGVGYYLAFVR